MPKYVVTIRETFTYEVIVEADTPDDAIDPAVELWERTSPEPDSRSIDREDIEVDEVIEMGQPAEPRMRTIVFDKDGPHDLGDLTVGEVHSTLARAVGDGETYTRSEAECARNAA